MLEDLIRLVVVSYKSPPKLLKSTRSIKSSNVKQNSTASMGRESFVLVATKVLHFHRSLGQDNRLSVMLSLLHFASIAHYQQRLLSG